MKNLRKVLSTMLVFSLLLSVLCVPVEAKALKFNLSKATVQKAIVNRSMSVTVDGKEQRFAIKKSEIKGFKITKKTVSKKTATVRVRVDVDRKVANVRAYYTLKYKYKSGKWKLSKATQTSSKITKIKMNGTWEGTYGNFFDGYYNGSLTIDSTTSDGFFEGVNTYARKNASNKNGKYSVTGTFDKKTGTVLINYNESLTNTKRMDAEMSFKAHLDLYSKRLVGNNDLSLKKK